MVKNYCEKCNRTTNHEVLFEKKIGSKREEDFQWDEKYQVITCRGCDNIQFRKEYCDESMGYYDPEYESSGYFSDIKCFPQYLENHKILSNNYYLPIKIKTIYIETLQAFKANSLILAGAGFRAVIEAICLEENIKGRNLEIKINNLLKEKLITAKECNRLHSVRFIGNDSIHEMLVPERKKLYAVLNVVENLLNNLYLIDHDSSSILETVINSYNEFEELIWFIANGLNNGVEKTIKELLGKHIRRIESAQLLAFFDNLIVRIENNEIIWLEIDSKDTTDKRVDLQKFKIKK